MNRPLSLLFVFVCSLAVAQRVPTFEEVISLRSIGGVTLSADGNHIAYTVQTTDWNDNRFDTEIWLSKNAQKPFQLTSTSKNSSTSPAFSPDGNWIAFLADRGNKNQIHVMRLEGGEARAVTKEEEGISSFEWHPFVPVASIKRRLNVNESTWLLWLDEAWMETIVDECFVAASRSSVRATAETMKRECSA